MSYGKTDQEPIVVLKSPVPVENEHHPESKGINAAQPFDNGISASRKLMYTNNMGQIVITSGIEPRALQSIDVLLAKTTFSQKMPVRGKVVGIFHRYKKKPGDKIFKNDPPQTVMIFRNMEVSDQHDYDYGMVSLTEFSSMHPYLGFIYKDKDGMHEIKDKAVIDAGTIFRDSPGITEKGDYAWTTPVNTAMISVPGVAEDGIIISESMAKQFEFDMIERRVVEFGKHEFPLNIYGTDGEYKIHPNIGEPVGPHGCLMVLRSYRPDLAIAEMSVNACRRIDFQFDRKICVDGVVLDIKVHHDHDNGMQGTPAAMEEQPLKYDTERRIFYGDLLRWYNRTAKETGKDPHLSPELHHLIYTAISVVHPTAGDNKNVVKVHKKTPLDDYRIEFTVRNRITPHRGKKFTDLCGGKGIAVDVWKDEDMPIDAAGNRCHLMVDPASSNNRMIPARLIEQYLNGAARDVLAELCQRLDIRLKTRYHQVTKALNQMYQSDRGLINDAWEYLLGFYELISPYMAGRLRRGDHGANPISHFGHVISEGRLTIYTRSNLERETKDMISDIQAMYPPVWTPVTYRDVSGELVTTVQPIRIAPLSMIMLEKLGDGYSALSSGLTSHHGTLATLSNTDKYGERIRFQPTKANGETEIRLVISFAGTRVAVEIIDRNNNQDARRALVSSIYEAVKPTSIACAVDRSKISLDGSRNMQNINHIAACAGWEFAWSQYVPVDSQYMQMH